MTVSLAIVAPCGCPLPRARRVANSVRQEHSCTHQTYILVDLPHPVWVPGDWWRAYLDGRIDLDELARFR